MAPLLGKKTPLGTCVKNDGVNFAIFSQAPEISLLLFYSEAQDPFLTVPLDPICNKTGGIWHVFIPNLSPPFEYLYKVTYPNETAYVHDPYAKGLSSALKWGIQEKYEPRGRCFISPTFDWQGVKKPNIPLEDLVIYEMHIRGFTQDDSSLVPEKGTFLGMIHKIPHLLSLGINAVELLPVFEFNECENIGKKGIYNFWGYSTVNFFCPMQRYAHSQNWEASIQEFKTLVRELHKNGIAVILDVVYNHTAENGSDGTTISYKGLAKHTYYSFDEEGEYFNFSGTGNTFNCNNPVTSKLIVDSLSYWASEMQIDGFRFDLASIFTRGPDGKVMEKPPLLELIQEAPLLQNSLLIAEAWDAGGLYQVGSFPGEKRWSEWNGQYRDTVRKFIKGTDGQVPSFMQALCGSQELYFKNSPLQSINFITAHDGYTLNDLVSYQQKHNEANKENNKDGANDNESWNCGVEGDTEDKAILLLRMQQIKNFQMALLLSLGIPMIFMGDEYGHTKHGNNNTYCLDNQLNWFLWDELEKNKELFRFMKNLIQFRKEKSSFFCKSSFLIEKDIEWLSPNLEEESRFISYIAKDLKEGKDCLIAFNADFHPITISLPTHAVWVRVADTALSSPWDFIEEKDKRPLAIESYLIAPRSAIILEAICSR